MGAALGVLRQAQPPRAPNLKRKAGEAVEAPAPACDPRMPPPKSAKKAAPAAASAAAERWDRVSRPVYQDLPSKYQLVKEESARLEAVWRCVAIKKVRACCGLGSAARVLHGGRVLRRRLTNVTWRERVLLEVHRAARC